MMRMDGLIFMEQLWIPWTWAWIHGDGGSGIRKLFCPSLIHNILRWVGI